jgi:acetyl esterase/lipase
MYIHGGSWQTGSKNHPIPPFVRYLAMHKWVVVCINHRLAPTSPYPTHLQDCKRALRWIHQNIHHYGGDKQFVFVSGTQSGGHLASMMAFTANDPFYQKGFETLDTSVQGVVVVNGILDVCDYKGIWGRKGGFPSWFARRIAGLSGGAGSEIKANVSETSGDKKEEGTAPAADTDAVAKPVETVKKDNNKGSKKNQPAVFGTEEEMDFLRMSSPVLLLKYLEIEKRKSTAIHPAQVAAVLSNGGNVDAAAGATSTSPSTSSAAAPASSTTGGFRGKMRSRAFSSASIGTLMEKFISTSRYMTAATSSNNNNNPFGSANSLDDLASKPFVIVPAEQLPPFLVFHGSVDSLVPVSHVRDFVSSFKKVAKNGMTYIEFPVSYCKTISNFSFYFHYVKKPATTHLITS